MRRPDHVLSALVGLALISPVYMLGRFTALPGDSPVVVAVGDTAVLYCHTSVPYKLEEVRWLRIRGGIYSMINLFRNGKDQQKCDLPEYAGRTELVKEGLSQGSVALKLFNVSIADDGTYRCYLETVDYFDSSDLKLSANAVGSVPRIDIEEFQDGGIKAVCRSAGWYPKPTLMNKEDDGEMEIKQEENGLYSIEYSRIIATNSNWTFCCRIQTLFPHQEREASIYVAVGLLRRFIESCFHFFIRIICVFAGVQFGLWTLERVFSRCCPRRRSCAALPEGAPEEGSSKGRTAPDCGLSE